MIEWERVGDGWEWKPGADAKRLIAFKPQSTGSAIVKEAMLRIRDQRPDLLAILRLTIHDSLLGISGWDWAPEFGAALAGIMEQPNKELGGLIVGTEVKRGKSWLMEG